MEAQSYWLGLSEDFKGIAGLQAMCSLRYSSSQSPESPNPACLKNLGGTCILAGARTVARTQGSQKQVERDGPCQALAG